MSRASQEGDSLLDDAEGPLASMNHWKIGKGRVHSQTFPKGAVPAQGGDPTQGDLQKSTGLRSERSNGRAGSWHSVIQRFRHYPTTQCLLLRLVPPFLE